MYFRTTLLHFDSDFAAGDQAVGAMPKYRLPVDAVQTSFEIPADESGRDGL